MTIRFAQLHHGLFLACEKSFLQYVKVAVQELGQGKLSGSLFGKRAFQTAASQLLEYFSARPFSDFASDSTARRRYSLVRLIPKRSAA
jgi:hypothetical protein